MEPSGGHHLLSVVAGSSVQSTLLIADSALVSPHVPCEVICKHRDLAIAQHRRLVVEKGGERLGFQNPWALRIQPLPGHGFHIPTGEHNDATGRHGLSGTFREEL